MLSGEIITAIATVTAKTSDANKVKCSVLSTTCSRTLHSAHNNFGSNGQNPKMPNARLSDKVIERVNKYPLAEITLKVLKVTSNYLMTARQNCQQKTATVQNVPHVKKVNTVKLLM